MSKWCKWYCFEKKDLEKAKKTCNKSNCLNKKRAEQIQKEQSYKLLDELMKNLY